MATHKAQVVGVMGKTALKAKEKQRHDSYVKDKSTATNSRFL